MRPTPQCRRVTACISLRMGWLVAVLLVALYSDARAQDPPKDPIRAAEDLRDSQPKFEMDLMNIVKTEDNTPSGIERKQLALQLLGDVGSISCVPFLIEHIGDYPLPEPDPRRPDVQKNPPKEPEPTPAMLGLRGLGPIAVVPVVNALCEEKDAARARLLTRTIEGTYCRELVVALVEYRWRNTDNTELRGRLDGLHLKLTGESMNK